MRQVEEFHELFETGQYGRIFVRRNVSTGTGLTVDIYVLPARYKVDAYVPSNLDISRDIVKVYGAVSRTNGRDNYGWLYGGDFRKDFLALFERKKNIRDAEKNRRKREKEEAKLSKENHISNLLFSYKKGDCP